MAILHIYRCTEKEEDFQDIESPSGAQIREAIQNCGVLRFTSISITGGWRFKHHTLKSYLVLTRGIKNRFLVIHHLPSVNEYLHLHRSPLDPAFVDSKQTIPIVYNNGERNLHLIKSTVEIEVAIAIATQYAEHGTFPDAVAWGTPPQFTAYLASLDAEG